MVEFHL